MNLVKHNLLIVLSIAGLTCYLPSAFASDHKHEKNKASANEKEKDDHGHDHEEDKKDDHKDEHGEEGSHSHKESKGGHEEEGEAKNVGPNKGIISYDEHDGFVLSPEAFKNFKIEYLTIQGSMPWSLPKGALVTTREDRSVYRNRNGKLLRVDVSVVSKAKDHAQIKSDDLRSGDQIVIRGAEFLRVAELDVTSGESGHHH